MIGFFTTTRKFQLFSILSGLLLLFLVGTVATFAAAPADQPVLSSTAFQNIWSYSDKPIQDGKVSRSWLWGDVAFKTGSESYLEAPGQTRQVEYFDKARMEITNPLTDPQSQWYVTNGLLVVEMMSGRLQLGNNEFKQYTPSAGSIAGDSANSNPTAPTYATFAHVATLNGQDNVVAAAIGQPANLAIDSLGNVRTGDAQGVSYTYFEPTLRHNIASVFWDFMHKQGTVWDYTHETYVTAQIFDWQFALGLPLTEPYWTTVRVGGSPKQVLVQAFQRRVLTYTPANDPAWQVEMGNVGRHYNDWRSTLTSLPSLPTPTVTIPSVRSPTPVPTPLTNPGTSPSFDYSRLHLAQTRAQVESLLGPQNDHTTSEISTYARYTDSGVDRLLIAYDPTTGRSTALVVQSDADNVASTFTPDQAQGLLRYLLPSDVNILHPDYKNIDGLSSKLNIFVYHSAQLTGLLSNQTDSLTVGVSFNSAGRAVSIIVVAGDQRGDILGATVK